MELWSQMRHNFKSRVDHTVTVRTMTTMLYHNDYGAYILMVYFY